MPIIPVDVRDERLAPYRNLRDKTQRRSMHKSTDLETREAETQDVFVVEGTWLVERLLASRYRVGSLLVGESQADRACQIVPADVPIYQLPTTEIHQLVGFHFHRGMLACGVREATPDLSSLLASGSDITRLLICPELRNEENLGSLLRTAAAFGINGVLLGPKCPDAFGRRVVRVSMGAALSLLIRQTADLSAELAWLTESAEIELIAAVLSESCETLSRDTHIAGSWGLMVGREDEGLSREWLAHCKRQLTIPIQLGTDSLNVAVAAGVMMYQLS